MGRKEPALNEAERQILGGALRQLRINNRLTLLDVANFHKTHDTAVSRYELGKASISPEKALNMLTSLVASVDGEILNSDNEVINATVAAIPPLAQELQLRQMIDQAVADGSALRHGTAKSIATTLDGGLSYFAVLLRLNQATGGR